MLLLWHFFNLLIKIQPSYKEIAENNPLHIPVRLMIGINIFLAFVLIRWGLYHLKKLRKESNEEKDEEET